MIELYKPSTEMTLQEQLVKGVESSSRKLQLPFFSQHSSSNTTESQSLTQSPPQTNDSEALLQTTPDVYGRPACEENQPQLFKSSDARSADQIVSMIEGPTETL